ncbi:MAG: hypothetical protein A2736_02305 [Candidatus Yanofskybacteria bacterium RIFCSPHIGHO2_01_FULL_41_27]|uniref:DOT1 domain-containing protein n=3 Tax=Parcubacteria group TaxID=1794811 RepID=A0A1F8HV43_9BACT|nr:MAG: hypothetical protein UU83_C0043G0005 [Candidatus Jorgensenbacteria bacterium GW2011_GWF2_41_8]OGN00535.1 MAG: hypothetical protein A2736_02305 [Candidatus Yanofskybacteria bacterium RIFCSPHIGHO2_01_FULL_41_27]OGN08804.1 MAG: hypothetical protein A3C64_02105 [Candidatus Yanofskybacteria bacterium RIFCSPHIGHO2_02_FULL_41_12]OGN21851.1 MAG: hypothetical protein A3B00_01415 [Candidatus Yanofskybacteria bacterium RIFCSPLOWO2_01_FULL_41_33]OGN41433.1 MAG: hypothetical protein A2606_03940 [Can
MQEWIFIFVSLLIGIILPTFVLFFLISLLFSAIAGAPYVPAPRKLIKNVLIFGGLTSDDVLFDLGCGDGRVLISGAQNFNVKKAIGYDIAFWPFLKAFFWVSYLGLNKNIKIIRKNCVLADIGDATFIFLYLFPKLVDQIAYKIAAETKNGIKILSLGFPINTEKHPEFIIIKFQKLENLIAYLYEIKKPLRVLNEEHAQRFES